MADLEIRNLHVRVEDREILKGVDLDVSKGEIHALMGPNGSGKSTLASTIMGHPSYEVTEGTITFRGEELTEADPEDRAHAGLFLAFQYPVSIPGVSIANFLRMAINTRREDPINVKDFRTRLQHAVDLLDVERSFTSRHVNDGFSGGEKKRAEILQMAMLRPEVAVLDETDSGLDIDALRTVAEGVNKLHGELGMDPAFAQRNVNEGFSGGEKKRHEIVQLELLKPKIAILDETDSGLDIDALRVVSAGVNRVREDGDTGILLITHYTRILRYVQPDYVHVFVAGRIVEEGGPELADKLEAEGYERYLTTA